MAKQHLLIVDSDPKSLRVLEVSLKKAGFSITKAQNGVDAIDKIKISAPDLIISETSMPKMDGYELLDKLKEFEEWADIPVIFLTAQKSIEDKVRGLEQGVEDYLTKPIFIREILARIQLVMQRRQRKNLETRGSKTEFAGNLNDMGIIDLIQTIDISQKSGVIQINNEEEEGSIYFRSGKVIDAETRNRKGEEAVYRMLVWSEGTFHIEFNQVDRDDNISLSTQGLLMEGMRRLDEWGRLQEQLPPLNSVFDIDDDLLAERLGEIPDEINGLLRHFDGERTLMDVVDMSDMGDLEALTIITKLYFEGLICDMGIVGERDSHDPIEDVDDSVVLKADDNADIPPGSDDPPPAATADSDPSTHPTIRAPRQDLLPTEESAPRRSLHGNFVSALSMAPQAPSTADPSSGSSNTSPEDPPRTDTSSFEIPPEVKESIRGHGNSGTASTEDATDKQSASSRTTEPPPGPTVKPSSTKPVLLTPSGMPMATTEAAPDAAPDALAHTTAGAPDDLTDSDDPIDDTDDHHTDTHDSDDPIDDTDTHDSDDPIDDTDDHHTDTPSMETHADWDPVTPPSPGKRIAVGAALAMLVFAAVFAVLISRKDDIKSIAPTAQETAVTPPGPPATDSLPAVTEDLHATAPRDEPASDTAIDTAQSDQATDTGIHAPLSDTQMAQYTALLKKAKKSPRRQKLALLLDAIDMNPTGIEALSEFVLITMESSNYQDQALEYAHRVVDQEPKNAKMWLAIGWIHQQKNNDEEAKDAYRNCAQGDGPPHIMRDCTGLLR